MGSIAVTTGTVRVRDCPGLRDVLKNLGEIAEGMDERQIDVRKADEARYGAGVLEVEINISGHTSASRATAIDEKIRKFGAYAIEAGRFDTEWECEKDHFFVGTDEQVAVAESADALERIQALAPKLRGDDITAALNVIVCDTQMPAFKRKYLDKSGSLAPSARATTSRPAPCRQAALLAGRTTSSARSGRRCTSSATSRSGSSSRSHGSG